MSGDMGESTRAAQGDAVATKASLGVSFGAGNLATGDAAVRALGDVVSEALALVVQADQGDYWAGGKTFSGTV